LSCADATRENAPSCSCKTGFYDNAVATCASCSHPCSSCTTDATTCSACVNNTNRGSFPACACNAGFYDDGTNCLACDNTKCATCSGAEDSCIISCNAGCDTCDKMGTCNSCSEGTFLNSLG